MHAEIIAIGSELTSGAKLDTNSQWLSIELGAIGIPVRYHVTVADEMDAMLDLLRQSVARSDIVLITGGLGPTLDDLTRHLLAALVDRQLVLDQPSLDHIRSLFARRKREMPERNNIQAMFPEGSEPLFNPRGSAPGIWMEVGDGSIASGATGSAGPSPESSHQGADAPRSPAPHCCRIAAMPGVPSEMMRMFRHEVLPRLTGDGTVIRRARVNMFGVGESHAEERLGELTARGRDPEVGITVHEATITLRITAVGHSDAECRDKIDRTKADIRERMGDYVFGEEDDELEHVVVRLLNERGLTLSTAESGTGGLVAHRLTEVERFESCYVGGVIAPTDSAKQELLGVPAGLIERAGSVSADVVQSMATGCRTRFGTDFALAVTECPRFDPDDVNADAPTTFIALATAEGVQVTDHVLLGDPAITKSRAAKTALNLLRLYLLRGETSE